jgi:hypothetical protein
MIHLRIEERPHNKLKRKETVGRNKTDGKISSIDPHKTETMLHEKDKFW